MLAYIVSVYQRYLTLANYNYYIAGLPSTTNKVKVYESIKWRKIAKQYTEASKHFYNPWTSRSDFKFNCNRCFSVESILGVVSIQRGISTTVRLLSKDLMQEERNDLIISFPIIHLFQFHFQYFTYSVKKNKRQ